jgi:hypothetical protein
LLLSLLEQNVNQLNNKDIATIIYLLAKLNHTHYPFIFVAINLCKNHLSTLTAREISNMIWSLTILSSELVDDIKMILDDIYKLMTTTTTTNNFTNGNMFQIYQVALVFQHSQLIDFIVSQKIIMIFPALITNTHYKIYQYVQEIIHNLSYNSQNYQLTNEYPLHKYISVDILLEINGKRIAIDVNGAIHYLHNLNQKTGNQIIKEKIYTASGVDIIEINLNRWDTDTLEFYDHLRSTIMGKI